MKAIAQHVEELITESVYLEECLRLQIINYSALAERLVPEIELKTGKKVKAGAIMMALRRIQFPTGLGIKRDTDILLHRLGNITLRMNLVDFTFKNSTTLMKCQANLLTNPAYKEEDVLSITKGIHETNILVNANLTTKIKEIFKEEKTIGYTESLSAISIELPKESSKIKGLYYQLFKRIAWEGISIYEVVSTTNEISLILNDEVVDRAFSIIKKIKLQD